MFRQSGSNSFDVTNDGFTKGNLVCAWIFLAFSTLVFFGSLIVIVWIVTYSYPPKWTFSVYIAAAGTLFLTNVVSNALIISTKQKLSAEDRRISMRCSMIRRRLVDTLENQIIPNPEAPEGFCHQEVQTIEVTKTPPPPYEDLPNGNAEANHQLTPNEAQIREPPVSEDVKQLLNKILHAINTSRTLRNEQPSQRTQESKCDHCKTRFPKSGTSTGSQQRRNAQTASSESGIYPKLPEEVLEHIADPPAFIRALAKYQSENRKREYEENKKKLQEEKRKKLQEGNRKIQLAKQETFHMQALPNLMAENLVENLNQVSNKQTNIATANNEFLKPPSQNVQRFSPSEYLQQELKAKTQSSEQDRNYVHPTKTSQDLGSQLPIRNLNTDDKSRDPTRASQANLSSQSPRVSRQDLNFTNRKEASQGDISSKNPRMCRHIAAINRTGISLQDLGSKSPQDTNSRNLKGIPLKDYQLKKNAQIPNNLKSGNPTHATKLEDIPFRHLEYEQAFDVADNPSERTSSTRVLQRQQLNSAAMQQHSESTSNSLPEQGFSNESAGYQNLNPEKWFAAWNRGLNRISRDTSILFGSRL